MKNVSAYVRGLLRVFHRRNEQPCWVVKRWRLRGRPTALQHAGGRWPSSGACACRGRGRPWRVCRAAPAARRSWAWALQGGVAADGGHRRHGHLGRHAAAATADAATPRGAPAGAVQGRHPGAGGRFLARQRAQRRPCGQHRARHPRVAAGDGAPHGFLGRPGGAGLDGPRHQQQFPPASRPNTGTITSYMRPARFLPDSDGMAMPKETRTSMTEATPQVTVYTTNT